MLLNLKAEGENAARDRSIRIGLKSRLEQAFDLGPDDAVSVSEIACFDPGCPEIETVILVMRAGEPTCAMKVPATMAKVTDIELECLAALNPVGSQPLK